MLVTTCIGYIGGDAEVKSANGNEFTTFRIAHSNRWTDAQGNTHDETTWVDCIMNGRPKVLPYLKKGTLVCAEGTTALRIYSSAKDRCMKAGLTINVRNLELLGGKNDDVPTALYNPQTGEEMPVRKFYHVAKAAREQTDPELMILTSKSGQQFVADRAGWVRTYDSPQTSN